MLLHGKRRPHLIDDSLPAVHERIVKRVRMQVSANSRADLSDGWWRFIKVEVRLVYGSEWGKVGVAEVSFGRGPGRRSRTERTVSFLRTIEGGGKGGESNWMGINDLPIKCSEW